MCDQMHVWRQRRRSMTQLRSRGNMSDCPSSPEDIRLMGAGLSSLQIVPPTVRVITHLQWLDVGRRGGGLAGDTRSDSRLRQLVDAGEPESSSK